MTSPFARRPANWGRPAGTARPPSPAPAPGPRAPSRSPGPVERRNLFEEQARNRQITWALIAGFVVFLAFLGFGFDVFVLGLGGFVTAGPVPIPLGGLVAVAVGGISAWSGYRYGDRAVLAACHARPVAAADPSAQVLRNVVAEMAIASGLPEPAVYVVEDPDPNAFATGRDPAHASIAVTRGLLRAMSRDELQGVIAHEMSHVRNLDVRTMTVVAALLGAVLLISESASRTRLARRSDADRPSSGAGSLVFVLWILSVALAPLVGQLLAMAVSRNREYLADASAAQLTRNPTGLADALEKLDAAAAPTVRIARGTAHLCIVDPLGRKLNDSESRMANVFTTHPPIRARIARLRQMAFAA